MTRNLFHLAVIAAFALLTACATPPGDTRTEPADPTESDEASKLPPAVTRATLGAADISGDGSAETPDTPAAAAAAPAPAAPAAPAAPDELIAHLRSQFSIPPAGRAEVRKHADWYVHHFDYLERVFERASPYLPHIAAEVEARGLPGEVAFLPVVESAFDPFAYSHGRAAGLWQIIPSTGKHFGLKQNWWYDGRRDVLESTRVALDYLEYLHGLFDGDWLLAVAAYNCGQGTVARAIRRNQSLGLETDFWSLKLPAETRVYVPRLLGLTTVLAAPDDHGVTLPEISPQPVFAVVELDGQIDLAVAAELAGLELAELQKLNPGFNRWATDPDGPHRLLVPVAMAADFHVAIAALPASEHMRWQRHAVRPGDTLGGIARRYDTTVEVLQSVNGLPGTRIRAGAHLMVPTSTRSIADYPLSADNRLADTQARQRAGRVRSEHTVRKGESLWSIARRHGVGHRELASWNGMAPGDTLSVGRTLVVWQAGDKAGTAKAAAARPGADPMIRRINYTVRRGDSLYRIANNFRVSVADIRRWNDLDEQRYLQPGQRLVLHVDVTAQSGG
ncbi:LysM peptidoglycan-binding domain-containing protein [Thioalkalivibrio sp. XN279]|uniref:lytic transglycosylase n=1 Tax=Thioalkalivibrio sp. XN279 TaxID=2714953 RepID=UPI00351B72E5